MKRLLIALGLMAAPAQAQINELTSVEAARAVTERGFLLVDVRTPSEWADTGLARGAKVLTLQDPDFTDKLEAITGGDRSRPVAFICRSGNRSATATQIAQKLGYDRAYNVSGGMLGTGGWLASNLPVRDIAGG